MSATHVNVVCDLAAHTLLDDREFLVRWRTLHKACIHATAFQAPHFVRAWYATYRAVWRPLIVHSQNADGELVDTQPSTAGALPVCFTLEQPIVQRPITLWRREIAVQKFG